EIVCPASSRRKLPMRRGARKPPLCGAGGSGPDDDMASVVAGAASSTPSGLGVSRVSVAFDELSANIASPLRDRGRRCARRGHTAPPDAADIKVYRLVSMRNAHAT